MSRQITLIAGQPQEFYEVGDFVRILAATDPLTIEFYSAGREIAEAVNVSKGYAEKFDLGTFDRVRLVSATTQAVQFVTRLGNVVQYDAAPIGDTAILSSVPLDLTAATLLAMGRPELPVASSSQNAVLAANTAVNVFTAAANVNGAVIWTAGATDQTGGAGLLVLIAKATAPGSVVDGELLAIAQVTPISTVNYLHLQKEQPTRLAAGLGLWWIGSLAGTSSSCLRSVRYSLL